MKSADAALEGLLSQMKGMAAARKGNSRMFAAGGPAIMAKLASDTSKILHDTRERNVAMLAEVMGRTDEYLSSNREAIREAQFECTQAQLRVTKKKAHVASTKAAFLDALATFDRAAKALAKLDAEGSSSGVGEKQVSALAQELAREIDGIVDGHIRMVSKCVASMT
jgi:hypothetical protein